jgi:hypothetical protein
MKRTHQFFLISLLGFTMLPFLVSAKVVINEIAWMGTKISATDEWIELINDSSETVSLDGWTLAASDGEPSIKLSGKMLPKGFFLLERTDDNAVPAQKAGQVYKGTLSNRGESLVLKNEKGEIVDSVVASSGWPAGDNTTKETMQRLSPSIGGEWVTAEATPARATLIPILPPTKQEKTQPEVLTEKIKTSSSSLPFQNELKREPVSQPQKNTESSLPLLFGSVGAGIFVGGGIVFAKRKLIQKRET